MARFLMLLLLSLGMARSAFGGLRRCCMVSSCLAGLAVNPLQTAAVHSKQALYKVSASVCWPACSVNKELMMHHATSAHMLDCSQQPCLCLGVLRDNCQSAAQHVVPPDCAS
jgi:hypothetical protein